jgi:hypothetical protein
MSQVTLNFEFCEAGCIRYIPFGKEGFALWNIEQSRKAETQNRNKTTEIMPKNPNRTLKTFKFVCLAE